MPHHDKDPCSNHPCTCHQVTQEESDVVWVMDFANNGDDLQSWWPNKIVSFHFNFLHCPPWLIVAQQQNHWHKTNNSNCNCSDQSWGKFSLCTFIPVSICFFKLCCTIMPSPTCCCSGPHICLVHICGHRSYAKRF